MRPNRKHARVAGLLYLVVVLTGPFLLIYVPGKLFVAGNASATASNILAHETLFRAHILVGIISELAFVGVVLALYRLLKDINHELAAMMVLLVLIDAPLAFLSVGNEVASLTYLRGAGFLTVFDKPQRDALATMLINFDQAGIFVSEVFWGLWLVPLGLLVYRSWFIPRAIGVWLIINGVTYVLLGATGVVSPEFYERTFRLTTPILFGEVALMLYLLLVGTRVAPSPVAAPRLSGA